MAAFSDAGGCSRIKPASESEAFSDEGQGLKLFQYSPNFCQECKIYKPPRAHHCKVCRRCVLRMDHHCPFTGNCIGMLNHGHFVLMYMFALVGLLYWLVMCGSVSVLVKLEYDDLFTRHVGRMTAKGAGINSFIVNAFQHFLRTPGAEFTAQFLIVFVANVIVISLGAPAIFFAAAGSTVIENEYPMKEFIQLKPEVYCFIGPGFYRLTYSQNLRQLLGSKWLSRILLPCSGASGVDIANAIAPTPCPAAMSLIKQRILQVEEQGDERRVES